MIIGMLLAADLESFRDHVRKVDGFMAIPRRRVPEVILDHPIV